MTLESVPDANSQVDEVNGENPPAELPLSSKIKGWSEVTDWFGAWPSFHDAEVLGVTLSRSGASSLDIHAFTMTKSVDETGHFVLEKHATVTFHLGQVMSMSLDGFNHQNVIAGLKISECKEGFSIELDPCYGLAGLIVVASLSISVRPGVPVDSIYAESRQA